MAAAGWKQLLEGASSLRGPGRYPIAAYSEFVPPPRELFKPYLGQLTYTLPEDDPFGWPVPEFEEERQVRPGLDHVADVVVRGLVALAAGESVRGFSRDRLAGNAAWPPYLAEKGPLSHERYVTLMPLALSKTQDDKGRVRWTLFGNSEQGPARAFWRSFFIGPRRQHPRELGEDFVRRLLHEAYGLPLSELTDLRKAGFRILGLEKHLPWPHWREEPLPDWADRYLWAKSQTPRGVRFLLTFRPFATLPEGVQQAYLKGHLHLLPCPASLLFWEVPGNVRLQHDLPFAVQIPLLHLLSRRETVGGLRVPQGGWLHEPRPDAEAPDDPALAVKNNFVRTHRFGRLHRHEDDLAQAGRKATLQAETTLVKALFSTHPNDLGLYGKPLARNVQMWTRDNQMLLDGPRADRESILRAAQRVGEGGLFGYRIQYPPMRVGRHEVYWHRPMIAYQDRNDKEPVVLEDAPLGYLTAYTTDRPDLARPVELWPRLLRRQPYLEALEVFQHPHDLQANRTSLNVRLLLDTWQLRGETPLPRDLARDLLIPEKEQDLDAWLASLPDRATDAARGEWLVKELERCLEPATSSDGAPRARRGKLARRKPAARADDGLTFAQTAKRSFEVAYWKKIVSLSAGQFINKSNGDCIQDEPTQKALEADGRGTTRHLDALGEYLLSYYRKLVARAGMADKVLVGDLPFYWKTDLDYEWMGGWLKNQKRLLEERDLIVVIPGRDRSRAVVMSDHYDTAFMLDRYDPDYGGTGARLAAAGADDNHSATVALMQAAPIFLEMSRARKLGCDVWLIHLTGEEFPQDCLGARHLSQILVEGGVQVRLPKGRWHDLSDVRVQGLYVLDMVAHNNDHEPDIFQIAPGTGRPSLWLAEQAHRATETWNAACERWNKRTGRRGLGRSRRSTDPKKIPDKAAFLPVRGEVRLPANPRSTLYNTDAQIFSDAGVPVVLFMENYDIDRTGYHDTHDTMENIDLDYGSAVTAIAIESVARAATEKPPK
jgi:hypothetical protein